MNDQRIDTVAIAAGEMLAIVSSTLPITREGQRSRYQYDAVTRIAAAVALSKLQRVMPPPAIRQMPIPQDAEVSR